MKTTIDLPDPLFRRAKATAAAAATATAAAANRGITIRALVTKAVENSLDQPQMSVTELLKSLPRVDNETAAEIMRCVEEYDAVDLAWQLEEETRES